MPTMQQRAEVLTAEIKKTLGEIKAAEAKLKQLGEELMRTLAAARAEVAAARTIVEYPTGRYECAKCKHSTLFTEPTEDLPACDNCGGREWVGHQPKVTKIEPPLPKQYAAGMYECGQCGARTAVAKDTDELSPCELCGASKLRPLQI